MAVQQAIIRPDNTGTSASGTWDPISSYTPLVAGGSNFSNLNDQNSNSGSNSHKPAWIRFQQDDIAGHTNDLIDFVRVAASWTTNASTKLHFSIWIGVSGVEYPNNFKYGTPPYNGGHTGDTWTGANATLSTREGRDHPTQPNGQGWTQTAVNAITLRAEIWGDSDVDIQLRELLCRIFYYRKPTISSLAVDANTTSVHRNATWDFVGDAGQNGAEFYLYAGTGMAAADAGWLKHGTIGASESMTVGVTDDGTYTLFLRGNLKGAKSGRILWSDFYSTTFTVQRPPLAPRLLNPTNGAKRDVAVSGWKTQWQFQHPNQGATQQYYQLRRRVIGGTYEYWRNATQDWLADATNLTTLNATASTEITWPAGAWQNGLRYEWSVNTVDQNGLGSGYAPNFSLEGDPGPTVDVTAPTGTINFIANPTISFDYTDVDSDPQDMMHARLYVKSVFNMVGFDPDNNTFPWAWDSGQIATAATSIDPPVLQSHTTYRAYVRAHSDGQWSPWDFEEFDMDLSGPAAPTLVVTNDQTKARNRINLQGHDNLLTFADSTLDDTVAGTGKWIPINCTLAQSATQAKSGTQSLRATSTGGDTFIQCGDSGSLKVYPVVTPGKLYTGMAFVRPNAAGDIVNVQARIRYFDAAYTWLSTSDVDGPTVALVAATWTACVVQDTVPDGAKFASLMVHFLGNPVAGKIWFIDEMGVLVGTTENWGIGGYAGLTYFDVEQSDDVGKTWGFVRNGEGVLPDINGQAVVFDTEVPARTQRLYRAVSYAVV